MTIFSQTSEVYAISFFFPYSYVDFRASQEDIEKVISIADQETQNYLLVIRDTMGRVSEINNLTWNDVNFNDMIVILKTRKKKGGNLTPRAIPMTRGLYEVLSGMYAIRDQSIPYIFSRRYFNRKEQSYAVGKYANRKKLMKVLCKKAGVRHFGFHALRHSGASIMDNSNVPIGDIQRILGHENRSTTEIYLHSIGNPERIAIDVFEKVSQQKSHTESHTESHSN